MLAASTLASTIIENAGSACMSGGFLKATRGLEEQLELSWFDVVIGTQPRAVVTLPQVLWYFRL